MINPVTTAQIFSTLGNSSSLIPLGIKDLSNITGMTAGAYVTGDQVEAKDRFIDESGTFFIWLLGIPFFKKAIDKTVYKLAKYNPNIDTRLLKNPEIFKKAKEHALPELKAGFEKVEKNPKIFKGLFLGKFAAATALTLMSYSALTKYRHKHIEKTVMKEVQREEELKEANQAFMSKKTSFKAFKPSFKGANLAALQQFMFDPVKNTMIIDGGITTERLVDARSPQDFMGYVIKEGGFWAFMYFAGGMIQKHIENKSAAKGKPIDLDIRVLQNEGFRSALSDQSIEKHLAEFSITGTDAEIYESLFHNPDNLVVKMAKTSGIIKTFKSSDDIDSQHYIDIEQIKGIKSRIERLYQEYAKSEMKHDDFFKEVTKLKRLSILKNIGACIGVLGIVIPGIMVAARFMGENNKEFQVKKDVKQKLGISA